MSSPLLLGRPPADDAGTPERSEHPSDDRASREHSQRPSGAPTPEGRMQHDAAAADAAGSRLEHAERTHQHDGSHRPAQPEPAPVPAVQLAGGAAWLLAGARPGDARPRHRTSLWVPTPHDAAYVHATRYYVERTSGSSKILSPRFRVGHRTSDHPRIRTPTWVLTCMSPRTKSLGLRLSRPPRSRRTPSIYVTPRSLPLPPQRGRAS